MVLSAPIRDAAKRCGLDELASRLEFEPAPFEGDAELLDGLEEAFDEEELDDREDALLELLIDWPQRSELLAGLVERGAFADRPLDAALFGWDALQLCLFHPDQRPAVEAMREAALAARNVLPPPGIRRTILKGEALAQAVWQSLQTRRHAAEPASECGRAKLRAVRAERVSDAERELLIAAALDAADLEAALILERYQGWEDPAEERAQVLEAALDRAFALFISGAPTYATYLLKLGLHLEAADDEARALLVDLYLQQGQLTLAREELATLVALEGAREDFRIGLAARVALLAGETEKARTLLASFYERPLKGLEEYVATHPFTVIAGCECAMVSGEGATALPAYLNALLCEEQSNWHGHRLQTYLNYLDDRQSHPPMLALHRFADCLIAYPSDSQLWSLFNRLADNEDVPAVARQQVLARVLRALPQSVTVWREVLAFAELPDDEPLRAALQRRLGSQTSVR